MNTLPREDMLASWHFCLVELLWFYDWVIGRCMVEKSVLMLMDKRIMGAPSKLMQNAWIL